MTPLQYASTICYCTKEVLNLTYNIALMLRDKPGVYVEAGVAAGAQIIAMAHAAPEKEIYAFDSFEGIPMPSNKDDQMPGIRYLSEEEIKALPNPGEQFLKSSGATAVTYEEFKNHILESGIRSNSIYGIKGWFEETVPGTTLDISFLRLDGDLYNSTYVCLEHLLPKVLPAGFVVIDDYALKGCRSACEDYFKKIGYEPKYQFIEGPDFKVAYFQK